MGHFRSLPSTLPTKPHRQTQPAALPALEGFSNAVDSQIAKNYTYARRIYFQSSRYSRVQPLTHFPREIIDNPPPLNRGNLPRRKASSSHVAAREDFRA